MFHAQAPQSLRNELIAGAVEWGVQFESLRPTPELSFAIREYGCIAGINVTASHNPKEYNGYKVYWEDGEVSATFSTAALSLT